ncbi:hypothetical protein [Dactylosporangium sp. NPDC049140]|uniref:hypothetical protein n=1 Tax=Dactylosporangium sp. NPDC049140 TaxID=3155647 RepID=UPI0033CAE38C
MLGLEFPIRPTTRQDVRDVLAHLHAQLGAAPVLMRFGGFGPGEAGFRSRNQTPYERSFSVSRRLAVLVGWPADAVQRLAELRYDAERFGFRHRYHGLGLDPDPDCYLVIGEVPPEAGDAGLEEMRSYLSAHPFTVPLGAADASVVLYRSTELPRATSVAIPLAEAGERNDGTDAIAAVVGGHRPD